MGSAAKPLLKTRKSCVREASIAEAKEQFTALIREVESGGAEIVVRRRGKAVARIVPYAEHAPPSGYGWMKGSATELGDIVAPLGEEWHVSGR